MDRYTKAVLTVIASALIILVAQNFVKKSSAQILDIQKVQICDFPSRCLSLNEITRSLPIPTDKPFSIPKTYKTLALPIQIEKTD